MFTRNTPLFPTEDGGVPEETRGSVLFNGPSVLTDHRQTTCAAHGSTNAQWRHLAHAQNSLQDGAACVVKRRSSRTQLINKN